MQAQDEAEGQQEAEGTVDPMSTRTQPKKTIRIKRPSYKFKVPEALKPWKIPASMTPSKDMSEEEMVLEAQESRPLLRTVGWSDSAMMHPNEMNIRYLRTCDYVGKLPIRPYVIQLLLTFGVAAGMALFFSFGPTQESAELAIGKGVYAIVGGVTGLVFGFGVGYSTRTAFQFGIAHTFARIAQRKTENGITRTVAVYELQLLRLAFADRHGEHMFSGIENKSGFISGRMNLETDLELSLVTRPDIFYMPGAVRACRSDFTGVSASRRHALNDMAKQAGRINAEKQQQRQNDGFSNWMAEHKGLTFFLVAAGVSLLVMFLGVELDPTALQELF